MKYLLDTDTCIYIINRHPESVLTKLEGMTPDDICISSITLSELHYGVSKSTKKDYNAQRLAAFLMPFTLLEFDEIAAFEYGRIRAHLEKQGYQIGPLDTFIAAHARSRNLILVTNNEREFNRVPGLVTQNWVE